MKEKEKLHFPSILLVVGLIILINIGCSTIATGNSVEPVVTREVPLTSHSSPLPVTRVSTPVASSDKHEEILTTSTITPSPVVTTNTQNTPLTTPSSAIEGTLATPTAVPSPVATTIDVDSLEWKIAIPHVTDSCQFTVADSSGSSFVLPATTPSGNPITCMAAWHPHGQQLAITSNNGIEIVDLNSKERIFLENPFLKQVAGAGYSLLEVAHDSWSKNGGWLKVVARNRFLTDSLETYQTIIFDTSAGETIIFEENFAFKAWSSINEDAFAYTSLESGGEYTPGVYDVGIWDVTSSQPTTIIEGLSEQYNVHNSQLILSPGGQLAALDVVDKNTASNITLMIDFRQGGWEVLVEEPANLIPWAWSPSGNWIAFYNSSGLYFLGNLANENSEITSLNVEDAIPIGWLPSSEDIFLYERNHAIYVLDPNNINSSTLLLSLTNFDVNIDEYTPIAVWVKQLEE